MENCENCKICEFFNGPPGLCTIIEYSIFAEFITYIMILLIILIWKRHHTNIKERSPFLILMLLLGSLLSSIFSIFYLPDNPLPGSNNILIISYSAGIVIILCSYIMRCNFICNEIS